MEKGYCGRPEQADRRRNGLAHAALQIDKRQRSHSCRASHVLSSVLDHVRNDYDFCIIDNGPSVDTVTLNVLAAADDGFHSLWRI